MHGVDAAPVHADTDAEARQIAMLGPCLYALDVVSPFDASPLIRGGPRRTSCR
jgi:hypothetical protein